jgi:hypothetical protein
MAYCVKCGVELQDKPEACPLCQTPVMLPPSMREEMSAGDSGLLYPDRLPRGMRKKNDLIPSGPVVLLVSILLLIPFLVTFYTDWKANGRISWSFYPMTSLVLLWLMVAYPALLKTAYPVHRVYRGRAGNRRVSGIPGSVCRQGAGVVLVSGFGPGVVVWLCVMLPFWLYRRPVWMALAYFVSVGLFLWLMEWVTDSGPWFLTLALPLTGAVSLCGLGFWIAFRVLKGRFASLALGTLLLTLLMVVIDLLIRYHLNRTVEIFWSPLAAAVGLPLSLLFLAIHRSAELRALLHKRFHL